MKPRRLLSFVHRYSGLLIALFVLLVALTGSLLVFSAELDRWLNPQLLRIDLPEGIRARPLAEQLAAAEASQRAAPDGPWQAFSLSQPRFADSPVSVLFRRPDAARQGQWRWRQVLVDPYQARVLGQRERSQHDLSRAGLLHLLSDLHGKLLLGPAGLSLMGCVAVLWLVASLLGLYLWWPGRAKLRLALSIKWRAGRARLLFDLHRAGGFYSAPVLLFVAASGIYLAWPGEVRHAVATWSSLQGSAAPKLELPATRRTLSPDAAAAIAQAEFPDGELRRIGLPVGPRDPYTVNLRLPGELNRPSPGRSAVWIDPSDGRVLKRYDARQASAGESFLAWQTPLHTGYAFGFAGRLAVCLGGLIAGLLAISGAMLWWRRQRPRRTISSLSLPTCTLPGVRP